MSATQLLLIWHGLSVGPTGADSSFGSSTEGAVLEFQHDNGLQVTGTVNEQTWERLVVALGPNDRGPHVEAAQRLLRAWNARLGPPIDGMYGMPTRVALKAFREAKVEGIEARPAERARRGRGRLASWTVCSAHAPGRPVRHAL